MAAIFLAVLPPWALVLVAVACISVAAIVAGLLLGIMSLDKVGLQILANSDRPESEHARSLVPIREKGNFLLVSLLLANTLVNELLPLVLEALFPGGYFSWVASVVLILFLGEIVPQAVCSRYGLEIGAKAVGFIRVLQLLLYPFVCPVAWVLDYFLEELGTLYSRSELRALVDFYTQNDFGILTTDEGHLIKGALDMHDKTVGEVMTKADDVFMLSVDAKLDRELLKTLLRKGHSRIPVYVNEPGNVVALLLVKQLLLINPDDGRTIRSILTKKKKSHKKKFTSPVYVSMSARLEEVLDEFQQGRSHLAIVYDDLTKPEGERKFMGIVTLEDIIEEILQEEIVDETDVYMDMKTKKPVLFRGPDGRLHRRAFIGPKKPHTQITIREIDVGTLKHSSSDPSLSNTRKKTAENFNKQVMRGDINEWSLKNLAYTTDDIRGYESDSDEASDYSSQANHHVHSHSQASNSRNGKREHSVELFEEEEQRPLLGSKAL
ncbi:metal transporter, ACDP family isoform 2 [Galdieria sulphuraria]|uniref:Metal transporter, ACDP family isoform 2 n=1 Tax=Galdieria sulphuraria TaxID=130081 RepID=M2WY78_GALSU|nr:metal transporter, ACDP family isoform 2 [Galdieria sulphuraria]EME29005.1 metal transporter, ACDP family isoform 2 [Galdieria sulphuraria]|eukprot:XP_005705525.1 metal transporter, ACDP family isoform 2 [Galdieria sulphuraria]